MMLVQITKLNVPKDDRRVSVLVYYLATKSGTIRFDLYLFIPLLIFSRFSHLLLLTVFLFVSLVISSKILEIKRF